MSIIKDIEHIISFKLPPKDAINYIEKKGYKLTFNYKEMMHEAHHKAFTVAKVTRLDLLSDIKEAILEAQKKGLSYQAFKNKIKPTLIKKGWWGEVTVTNPKTKETKTIFVGNRRLKNIFYTNLRVAYQVQKAKRYYEDENVKYLKYIAVLDKRTRKSHAKLHGTILPKDDEFWKTNFPPNGWNCRCRVRAIPAHKKVTPTDKSKLPKNITDKDWAYDVREGRFFDRFSVKDISSIDIYTKEVKLKEQTDYKDFNLPSLKEINRELFDEAPKRFAKQKTQQEAYELLKKEILQGKKVIKVKTPITDLLIDEEALKHIIFDHSRDDARERFAKYIIPTLTDPLEVWAVSEKTSKDGYYKKRYNFFKIFKTKKDNLFINVKLLRDGSFTIATIIKTGDLKYLDNIRKGILMFFNKKILEAK